jgi:hypothetical protein
MADRHDSYSMPTIKNVDGIWRVQYGGIIKEHRQYWQADWHYQQAMRSYLATRSGNN